MLEDIVHIKAETRLDYLLYSTIYDDYSPIKEFDFHKQSTLKIRALSNKTKTKPKRNPSIKKKQCIIQVLLLLMPENWRKFCLYFHTLETVRIKKLKEPDFYFFFFFYLLSFIY